MTLNLGGFKGTLEVCSDFGLARPGGIEPPTYWFEASHSIQLSYGRQIFALKKFDTEKVLQLRPMEGVVTFEVPILRSFAPQKIFLTVTFFASLRINFRFAKIGAGGGT